MMLSRKYAISLVKQGKANLDSFVRDSGKLYISLTRHERTDHFVAEERDTALFNKFPPAWYEEENAYLIQTGKNRP
jgi:hypothetical protein